MKMLRITLEGKTYDVGVEVLAADSPPGHQAPSLPLESAPSVAAPAPAVVLPAGPTVNAPVGGQVVASPMAGVVLKCLVREGDVVELNQMVLVLDAMKMETPIHAPVAGTVQKFFAREGYAVEEGETLLIIAGPVL